MNEKYILFYDFFFQLLSNLQLNVFNSISDIWFLTFFCESFIRWQFCVRTSAYLLVLTYQIHREKYLFAMSLLTIEVTIRT